MKVIVCIDDKGGMAFNHRRQSRDRKVIEDIVKYTAGSRLLMNEYSSPLFADCSAEIKSDAKFLNVASDGDYCFVENQSLKDLDGSISELVIYKWNRAYPADFYLDIVPENGRSLAAAEEFEGFSHEKITREVYIK